nr:putative reverse transcriptase domain-containing protein [Tanacetum cinerariifolium]
MAIHEPDLVMFSTKLGGILKLDITKIYSCSSKGAKLYTSKKQQRSRLYNALSRAIRIFLYNDKFVILLIVLGILLTSINMPTTRQGLSSATIEQVINQHVADAMAAYQAKLCNGNANQNEAGGSARAVRLTRWFKKMESVFHICNYAKNCQVKYATCTLLDSALTWWNSHVKTMGIDAAYAMTWKELMKMMAKVYYPRNKIQKLENEL